MMNETRIALTVENIKELAGIFQLRNTDPDRLSRSLAVIEEIPESCQFSDNLLDRMREHDEYWARRLCAMNGRPKDLDVLVHDDNDLVRFEVLFHKRPQDLQILTSDPNPDIREGAIAYSKSDCAFNGILGQ